MKIGTSFLLVLALALLAVLAVATTEECEVGPDGECLAAPQDDMSAGADEAATEEAVPIASGEMDDKCPDRDHIVRCAGAYLDSNGNGKLDREELDDGEFTKRMLEKERATRVHYVLWV